MCCCARDGCPAAASERRRLRSMPALLAAAAHTPDDTPAAQEHSSRRWQSALRTGAAAAEAPAAGARTWLAVPWLLIGGVRGIGAPPHRSSPAAERSLLRRCAASGRALRLLLRQARPDCGRCGHHRPLPALPAPACAAIRCGAGALCAGEHAGAGESRSAAGALAECGAWEQRAAPAVKRNRRRRASKPQLRRAWHPDRAVTTSTQRSRPSRPQARIRERP
jgi:hypothetical protein